MGKSSALTELNRHVILHTGSSAQRARAYARDSNILLPKLAFAYSLEVGIRVHSVLQVVLLSSVFIYINEQK